MSKDILYLVGKTIVKSDEDKHPNQPTSWEFQGVFDSKELALRACKTKYCFMAPVKVNEELPIETTTAWNKTGYYPNLEPPKE